ncbi:DUF732 domain-containing protein [Ornithinimicrobium cerasi]|uniref:DUF732 domain-containing protein n=1 Tax=Ornithinimicrobium cerasi TaxID=2248773 RepID=UPI001379F1EC|nr:DUF732 domain-containing protein [Ornithinimicrobium cerasi]
MNQAAVDQVAESSAAPLPADDAAVTTVAGSPEERYLASVRRMAAAEGKPDEQLLFIGNDVCTKLDEGTTIGELALRAQTVEGTDEQELAASQIVVAIYTLCPEQLPALAEFTEEQAAEQTN